MSVADTSVERRGPRRVLSVADECGAAKCRSRDKSAMFLCPHCYVVRYCSLECQRKHWKTHRCEPIVECPSAYAVEGEDGDGREEAATMLLQRGDELGSEVALYLGGVAALAEGALMQRRVSAVVSFVSAKHLSRKAAALLVGNDERRLARGQCYRALHYVSIEDDDAAPIGAQLEPAAQFIDEWAPLGGVLVHCMAGHSRSATVAAYYIATRVLYRRAALTRAEDAGALADEAISTVRQFRPTAYPSAGFAAQLREEVWRFVRDDRR